jgi:cytochrome b6-f complex iron-sulfur subunit
LTALEPTTTESGHPRSRRDMLCGLAVALVAPGALVAACGSDDSGNTGGDSGGSGGGSASTSTSTSAGGGGGGAGISTPLADIPDGGGLLVDTEDGGKALLVRNGDEVKAFNAACTHQGTIVRAPENGISVCPSHGSEFDTDGAVVKGPATKPLAELQVTVEGDQVKLA